MKIVIQRVKKCILSSDDHHSEIKHGLLVLVGVHKLDTIETVNYMAKKIATMRLFKDENGKLNKNIFDVAGEIMVVSNFTLLAEISSGTRPSFSDSADTETANSLYLELANQFEKLGVSNVQTGNFKHYMQIETILDGPLSIVIEK